MGLLSVAVEHSLRAGTLVLRVDGKRALAAPLSSRLTKKILFVSLRRGFLERTLEVAPGEHRIEVEMRWDENVEAQETRWTFAAGKTAHLDVRLGRFLKMLSLDWR
jgi:hypothetical protein